MKLTLKITTIIKHTLDQTFPFAWVHGDIGVDKFIKSN